MATSSGSWNGGEQIDEEMPEFLRIPPSDIKIGGQIGRGGFSTVHKASWSGRQCAAKIVQTADVRAIQREVAILSKLSHPHIVGCIGFSVESIGDPSGCMILMELMESDLRHLMKKRLKKKIWNTSPFSEAEAVAIIRQISSGMEYLHRQGVFHGDLKAANVLVSHDCDGKLVVKITDFGVSQMVKLDPAEKSEKFIRKKHFRGIVGTRAYQAPEVSSSSMTFSSYYGIRTPRFRGPEDYQRNLEVSVRKSEEFYSARADIYCFAMTCYEIFSGLIPFESVGNADIPALVSKGVRPELPHGLDRGLVALIEMCWNQTPSKRPRFSEIRRLLESWERRSAKSSLDHRLYELQSLQRVMKDNIQFSEDPIILERIRDSEVQSRQKAPTWWSRLLRRFRRGHRK